MLSGRRPSGERELERLGHNAFDGSVEVGEQKTRQLVK